MAVSEVSLCSQTILHEKSLFLTKRLFFGDGGDVDEGGGGGGGGGALIF